MSKSKRLIVYGILFVFGILLSKSIFPSLNSINDCDEFGHIHMYHLDQSHGSHNIKVSHDDNCHSGKNIFTFSIPTFDKIIEVPIFEDARIAISSEKSPKNPFIEPRKKPPRYS